VRKEHIKLKGPFSATHLVWLRHALPTPWFAITHLTVCETMYMYYMYTAFYLFILELVLQPILHTLQDLSPPFSWRATVWGRPTFNTPAPLLQELGLNNTHTDSCITHGQLYYGNDSCITETTAVLRKRQLYYGNDSCITESHILSLESCYSYTSNNAKYVHTTLQVDQTTRLYLCTT
jgi:hypothetical protein